MAKYQVGLDFGTSSTKIMYVRLGTAERRIRPLIFAHGLSHYPEYCLPSVGAFDKRGNLLLADRAARVLAATEWTSGLSRVKMLVAGRRHEGYRDDRAQSRYDDHVKAALGDESRCPPEALMATFLAVAMRRVRRHIERETAGDPAELWFNTCVPIDQTENDPVLAAFRETALVAERLERDLRPTQSIRAIADQATQMLVDKSASLGGEPSKVYLVPEALAASANYVASLRRSPGLHAVIDIGSGTTDVSVFHLSLTKKRGAITDWFAARSIPMGAGHVERWVASELHDRMGVPSVLPGMIQEALQGAGPHARSVGPLVDRALTTIWNRTTPCWAHAYGHLANAEAWKGDKVKVFLSGGGGLIPAAQPIFAQSWGKNLGPYPCSILPAPDGAAGTDAPFARLCVAYGLTTPVPEMGNYVLPANAGDHTPAKLPVREPEQTGDQLLPKYGWT